MSKLVLVPSADNFGHDHVLPYEQGKPERRTKWEPARYNPLSDYLLWYRIGVPKDGVFESSVHVSDQGAYLNFWNFREEVEAWVNERCSHHVLVQRNVTGWKFHFFDPQSTAQDFTQFVSVNHRDHRFHFLYPEENGAEMRAEMDSWLAENIKGETLIHENSNILKRTIYIRDTVEATHFRLRWTDHVRFLTGDPLG